MIKSGARKQRSALCERSEHLTNTSTAVETIYERSEHMIKSAAALQIPRRKNSFSIQNKKAILETNTVQILVIVLVIVVLAVGVGKIYNAARSDLEKENAQKFINILKKRIDATTTPAKTNLQGFTTETSWLIVGWSKSDINRPDACFFKSCVCLCPHTSAVDKEKLKQSCQAGFCRQFSQPEIKAETYKTQVTGYSEGKEIKSLWVVPTILVQNQGKIMQIEIEKNENSLTLKYYSDDYLAHKNELQ